MRGAATRAGAVAVVGAPNAGKSTLVNALVGGKVSIVSPKVQTTRTRIVGIAMRERPDGGRTQIALLDTPGIFRPGRFKSAAPRLERAMVRAAWQGAEDADLVLLVVDASRGLEEETRAILAQLAKMRAPRALALNKIDLVPRDTLLAFAAEANALASFERTFMISAKRADGVEDVAAWLAERLPESPLLYPEDDLTDMPLRLLAAEMTREQVFLQLHEELPYAVAVETDKWEERKDGSARVEQTIFVRREGQRAIVLGKQGARIREIGRRSRESLTETVGRPVHLFLHVKVKENWPEDRGQYEAWGLDFNAKE